MPTEKTSLRIKAERLGNVSDVVNLLTDIEKAYNSIYAFEFLVNTLSNDIERKYRQYDERYHRYRKLSKEFQNRKEFPYDPFFYEMFFEEFFFNRPLDVLPNLLETSK